MTDHKPNCEPQTFGEAIEAFGFNAAVSRLVARNASLNIDTRRGDEIDGEKDRSELRKQALENA